MKNRAAAWIALLLILLPAAVAAQAADSSTTVYIVRHAEKDTAANDPALTPQGRLRAGALAHVLSAAALNGVIASDRRRTLETAGPAARERGVRIDTMAREGTVEGYAARIASRIAARRGQSLLVVSHSDVIPALLRALGIEETVDIPDGVYDDLFIVAVPARGRPTLCRLKYGAPSP